MCQCGSCSSPFIFEETQCKAIKATIKWGTTKMSIGSCVEPCKGSFRWGRHYCNCVSRSIDIRTWNCANSIYSLGKKDAWQLWRLGNAYIKYFNAIFQAILDMPPWNHWHYDITYYTHTKHKSAICKSSDCTFVVAASSDCREWAGHCVMMGPAPERWDFHKNKIIAVH